MRERIKYIIQCEIKKNHFINVQNFTQYLFDRGQLYFEKPFVTFKDVMSAQASF